MSKISTFFYILYKSLTSLDYYYDITQAKLGFSIKFFIGFSIIYAALYSGFIYKTYITPLDPLVNSLPQHFSTVFPDDLNIFIQNGQVKINQPEPYFIGTDRLKRAIYQLGDQVLGADSHSIDYLLVVDTNSGIENFYQYNTFALLTKNSLIYLDPNYKQIKSGQVRVKALPLVGITTILNQQVVEGILTQLLPMFKGFIPVVIILIFILTLLIFPYINLLYIFLMAALFMFIGKILHMSLDYSKYFQICTHLFASISLIILTLKLIGFYPPIPVFRFTVMILAGIVILVHIRDQTLNRRKQLKVS